jgi:hypothetical protein
MIVMLIASNGVRDYLKRFVESVPIESHAMLLVCAEQTFLML